MRSLPELMRIDELVIQFQRTCRKKSWLRFPPSVGCSNDGGATRDRKNRSELRSRDAPGNPRAVKRLVARRRVLVIIYV
jgi:hypothetical protein